MHQKTVVEKAMEYCCCATYRAVGLDEKCAICELVDEFIKLDDQRADMWRAIHTVKIDQEGAMSLTESLHALITMIGETNEALAACQSEGQGWKRLAEERAWKNDSYEYLLSEPGSKTLYWAAVAIANAIRLGVGGMIRGTAAEQDLRDALWLREGEIRDVPKGSTVRSTVTVSEVQK